MAKIFDFIMVEILIFFLTLVWVGLLVENLLVSVIVSVSLALIFALIMNKLKGRGEKPYAYDRLALELSVKGPNFLIEILKSILKNRVFESSFNYICLENALIYVCFKFGNVGLADLPGIYSTASKYSKSRVFLFAKGIERKALRLLESYGIYITLVKIKQIYKLLKKHNSLPDLSKKRTSFSMKDLPSLLLSKGNTKGLIFSGAVLITTAFFTPLKIYYLVFGSIALLLAILSLTPLGKDLPRDGKFKDLFATENSAEILPEELNFENLQKSDENEKSEDIENKTNDSQK